MKKNTQTEKRQVKTHWVGEVLEMGVSEKEDRNRSQRGGHIGLLHDLEPESGN